MIQRTGSFKTARYDIPADVVQSMVDDYNKGVDPGDIADRLFIGKSVVVGRLKKRGVYRAHFAQKNKAAENINRWIRTMK